MSLDLERVTLLSAFWLGGRDESENAREEANIRL
jgi:hypothetical protein